MIYKQPCDTYHLVKRQIRKCNPETQAVWKIGRIQYSDVSAAIRYSRLLRANGQSESPAAK